MMQLNKIGELLGKIEDVHAMTDVTGFGLLGHLVEMAEGSQVSAEIYFDKIPMIIYSIKDYIDNNCIPGGTVRNWESYGEKIGSITDLQKAVLADPQTSGGLLIAVDPQALSTVQNLFISHSLNKFISPIGKIVTKVEKVITVTKNEFL